jgi:hypothetical protein
MFLPFGVAAFIGPRLAAVIKATDGSYSKAFMIASALGFAGIALAIIASMLLQRRRQSSVAGMAQSVTS